MSEHLNPVERAHLDALFIALADEMECEVTDVVPPDLHSVIESILAGRVAFARADALYEWSAAMDDWLEAHPDHDLTAEDVASNAMARASALRRAERQGEGRRAS